MKIKSAQSFRKWYRNLNKGRKSSEFWDENFMGAQYGDISGFFAMYHGDKEEIKDFLRKEVEMAEDGQAIYEFVQNAADSDATQFYMMYNKDYLLVINNGSVFTKEGIRSILNIGQSYGKKDPSKIGRYGIGFKLVHRLVGKSSGLEELLNEDNMGYRGPILFSWSQQSQFLDFISADSFDPVNFEDENAPWLLKILLTNFPAQPLEHVKNDRYEETEPFKENELKAFQYYLKDCLPHIDKDAMKSGTIFFLKLGDKKYGYLEKQKEEYVHGLSTSMHFLKNLKVLNINNDSIFKDSEATKSLSFTIKNDSETFNKIGLTESRDKESDANFTLCFANNINAALQIKKHPNIYKYFPAVKEVNSLSFIIHSNLFELTSNRQNLTETSVNKKLLTLLSKKLIRKMDELKNIDREAFIDLYISILTSDKSSSSSSGSGWQDEYFYDKLNEYIQENIPTKENRYGSLSENVKIKKTKLEIKPEDVGLSHIEWFEWDYNSNISLLEEAKKDEKLGLRNWGVKSLIRNGEIEKINHWITTLDASTYSLFLNELKEGRMGINTKEKLKKTALFKFSDGKFYAYNDIIETSDFDIKEYVKSNMIFLNNQIKNVQSEIKNLGIIISEIDPNSIFDDFQLPRNKKLYQIIKEKCATNTLEPKEKENLFLTLNNPNLFHSIEEIVFNDLALFCNEHGAILPIKRLITKNFVAPSWAKGYKIREDEWFPELEKHLISTSKKIIQNIFIWSQDVIVPALTEIRDIEFLIDFYRDGEKTFFEDFIVFQENDQLRVTWKRKDKSQVQVYTEHPKTKSFIQKNCTGFFLLPPQLEKYKDKEGIIQKENLHNLIVQNVDVYFYRKSLMDILKNEAQIKLIQGVHTFIYDVHKHYTEDDYEYKVVRLACRMVNDHHSYIWNEKKIIITNGEERVDLTDIPPVQDTININEREFNLSRLLPSSYHNSHLLSQVISKFVDLGLKREDLNKVFRIYEEIDKKNIFKNFIKQENTLANTDQFFFWIYYNLHIEKVDISILGFEPAQSVYPSEYALETEKLPDYLIEWIENEDISNSDLEKIKVHSSNSTLVNLRKFFLKKQDFDINKIAQDPRLANENVLLRTFQFLKDRQVLLNEKEYSVFTEMIRVININRSRDNWLNIEEHFDFKKLKNNSTFKESIEGFSIYLYSEEMPILIKLNEIEDYIFYRFNKGDYAIKGHEIFINEQVDQNTILQKIAADDNNSFSFQHLSTTQNKTIEELKARVIELENQLNSNAILGIGMDYGLSTEKQKEANREAREIVKEELEPLGFVFTQGIGHYSTVNGVVKDGIEYPIVIKSYSSFNNQPFKIGANEWIQLMKENSMFFIHRGNRNLSYLKLNDLLKKQDNITLSFSTENLEQNNRIENFAQLLRYFKNVHFNFESLIMQQRSIANNLDDLFFNNQKTETDLSEDHEESLH